MSFTATLKDVSGNGFGNIPLQLVADGKPIAQAVSDSDGQVVFNVEAPANAALAIRADLAAMQSR